MSKRTPSALRSLYSKKTSLQTTEQYDVLKLFVFGYECDFFQGRHIWLHN